jgi:hypothetical protein
MNNDSKEHGHDIAILSSWREYYKVRAPKEEEDDGVHDRSFNGSTS